MDQIFARVMAGFLLCCGAAGFAQAKDFSVSTTDEVSQALNAAQGGDRIVLAPADPFKALNDFHGIRDLVVQNDIAAYLDNQSSGMSHGIDFTSPTFDASHPQLASLNMITASDFLLI